jgi:hypothetical protein
MAVAISETVETKEPNTWLPAQLYLMVRLIGSKPREGYRRNPLNVKVKESVAPKEIRTAANGLAVFSVAMRAPPQA